MWELGEDVVDFSELDLLFVVDQLEDVVAVDSGEEGVDGFIHHLPICLWCIKNLQAQHLLPFLTETFITFQQNLRTAHLPIES